MKVEKRDWERMASKVTTVSNVSTTPRFPVERADDGKPIPRLKPLQEPAPPVAAKPPERIGVSKVQTPLRAELEARAQNRPKPSPMSGILRTPVLNPDNVADNRPEGIGRGRIPPGAIKMR